MKGLYASCHSCLTYSSLMPHFAFWHELALKCERNWERGREHWAETVKKPSRGFVFSCSFCWYKRHIIKYGLSFQPGSEGEDIWNRATADHSSSRRKFTIDTVGFRDPDVICYCSFTYGKQTNKSWASVVNKFQRSRHFHISDFACFPYLYNSRPSLCSSKSAFVPLSFLIIAAYSLQWFIPVSSAVFCFSSKIILTLPVKEWLPFSPLCSLGHHFDPHMRCVIYIKHSTNTKNNINIPK